MDMAPHSGVGGWGTVTPLAGKQQPRAGALHRQEPDLTDEPQTYFSSILRMRQSLFEQSHYFTVVLIG